MNRERVLLVVLWVSGLALWAGYFLLRGGGEASSTSGRATSGEDLHHASPAVKVPIASSLVMTVPYHAPPRSMELCGESVPLHQQDVMERFDREFTIVVYNHAQVFLWLKRLERYGPWLDLQLANRGLPTDLKYVAVAESDLMVSAHSPAGAVGPWQFIAGTGCRYGLDQAPGIDERYDFEQATDSALRYLQDLHGQFQSWSLAMAAYNCGEKRVEDELRRQKANSYYSLKLPSETERYVFRILAIKEVLSHPERYGYQLPSGGGYQEIRLDAVMVQLPHTLPLQVVAEAAGVTYREFKMMNPALVSDKIPEGSLTLRVPEGTGSNFAARLEAVKTAHKPTLVQHNVVRGETMSGIAERYDVSVHQIRAWNDLKGDNVQIGQVLKIFR